MAVIKNADLKSIVNISGNYCVSIYMPTTRVATEWNQNSVRFKNLIHQAEEELSSLDADSETVKELLDPLWELQKDTRFLQELKEGLAVFSGPKFFQYHVLPVSVPEFSSVSNRFHIKPLLYLSNHNMEYFLLAFSKHEVSLYKADRFSLEKIDLPDAPTNMDEFLRFDQEEEQLQFHTGTTHQREKRSAVYHGQGTGTDKGQEKEKTSRYIHAVQESVSNALQGKSSPLVLFTVEYLQGIYRKQNTYANLVQEGIHGNPEQLGDAELRDAAWKIVEPMAQQKIEDTVAAFHNEKDENKVLGKADTVLENSVNGRVHTVFVSYDDIFWGDYNEAENSTTYYDKQRPGAFDLLDSAARFSYLNGGSVYVLPKEQMPKKEPIAAVYRY
ncbi:MAG: hypothetical protein ACLFR1_09505 [Spirochaetia bacterium]